VARGYLGIAGKVEMAEAAPLSPFLQFSSIPRGGAAV